MYFHRKWTSQPNEKDEKKLEPKFYFGSTYFVLMGIIRSSDFRLPPLGYSYQIIDE